MNLKDSGDDSGDEVVVEVRMPRSDWEQLLTRTFQADSQQADALREWMGLYYRRDFDSCSAVDKLDWMERYTASCNGEQI